MELKNGNKMQRNDGKLPIASSLDENNEANERYN